MTAATKSRPERTGQSRALPAGVPNLSQRTYHHISQLREWGIEPHGTDDEWFAFVSASEATAIEKALAVVEQAVDALAGGVETGS